MDIVFEELGLDLTQYALPQFIAVEGCIGVGKTTLTRNIAQLFNHDVLLEQPEANPFLSRFYHDPRSAALQTQLFFLFQRANQLQHRRLDNAFSAPCVADYLMDKDELFARVTLDDDEFAIYRQVHERLSLNVPTPDLVIYLQAPTTVLLERIRQRGNTAEQAINPDYLASLNDAYTQYFHFYDRSPLLIVNAKDLDLANNREHFKQLVEHILNVRSGRHYFNPIPTL